jgi:adenylate cyclase
MVSEAASANSLPKTAGTPGSARVSTVLFADLTGAEALYDALGDAKALMHITRGLVLLEDQVYEHRGQIVKTIGVEVLSHFADPSTAAAAAIAMQQRMDTHAAESSCALGVKVGLFSGPVIEDGGDVFGDAVNIAARLVKLAHAGQILSDAHTVSAMRAPMRRRARPLDRLAVRGRSAEVDVMELGWRRRPGAPFTTEQGMLLERRPSARIMLTFEGREIVIPSAGPAFTIGRDNASNLCVASRKASRQHARIEWRRDKFVLFDHSTNGTYVTLDGEQEVMVKHESFMLRGRGKLRLGEAPKTRRPSYIFFECS